MNPELHTPHPNPTPYTLHLGTPPGQGVPRSEGGTRGHCPVTVWHRISSGWRRIHRQVPSR